ncbi:8-amino-7-oxononanoate synthase [Tistrella mobilis]
MILARHADRLAQLTEGSRRRTLMPRGGLDFTSNDYLGLAAAERMAAAVAEALARGVPVGAGGSRLLRGNHAEHEALEAEAARFFGADRMLFFGAGYAANQAVLATLPQDGDLVVHDRLIHASAHSGLRLGRAASVAVPHNDAGAVDDAIRSWRRAGGTGHPWIVAESLYSMDGDTAPLADLAAIASAHDGFLFIDEAHATGVHGPEGRGLAAGLEGRPEVIVLHTCGKALGAAGALVGADAILCDYLINRAKPFIYATAPSPLQAAAVRAALRILTDEPERRSRLHGLIATAHAAAARHGFATGATQILPVILGDDARTVRVARRMQTAGFDIRAIRPPTVPPGTARLRISITLNIDAAAIKALFAALTVAVAEETTP